MFERVRALCRGDAEVLAQWVRHGTNVRSIGFCFAVIALGCSLYGFTLGFWRSDLMAVYVAIKLPLLIVLTVILNGFLNGILAQLLGLGMGFRQTAYTILLSFTVFSIIVGALSPITFFMAWNTPEFGSLESERSHGIILLVHTCIIAYAGLLANVKMLRLLFVFSENKHNALKTFLAWTVGNLFLGAQLSYVLRPFFGSPSLGVQFLRDDPWVGNFYLSFYKTALNIFNGDVFGLFALFIILMFFIVSVFVKFLTHELTPENS